MAVMAKFRDLAPAFIITVGVLFVLFMIISDSNVLEAIGGRSQNVGSVNGKNISYQEYNNYVDQMMERSKQMGQEISPENMDQFRDQIWDQLVTLKLSDELLSKYGVIVTDQEVRDMIVGDNPPDFLKSNFIDSLGRFNKEAYLGAIFDKRNAQILVQAEELVRQQLLNQKLQNILNASVTVSEGEMRRKFIEQNVKMSAEYVLVDINAYPDNKVSVSDDEMKEYYNEHPEKFRQDEMRKVNYVLFPLGASKGDSQAVKQTLAQVLEKALADTNFKSYIDIYSETPYSKDTVEITDLPKDLSANPGNIQVNKIYGPLENGTGMALVKVLGVAKSQNTYVRASHILVASTGDDAKDLAEANKLYDELTKGANFAEYAKKYSKDPGSAANGGDLGWFGKGMMVKEFEDACFNGPVGQVQKPVKTSYGYHIIKVLGKSDNRYVVERLTQSIKPSSTTQDEVFAKASDFSYLSEKNGFMNEAKVSNYMVQESAPFDKNAFAVPGIGYNKNVISFAFDNGVNSVSAPFKIPQGYVVVRVAEELKEGVKKFDDVKAEIKTALIRDKKMEIAKKAIDNVKAKTGGDLSKANSIDGNARFGTTTDFTISGNIPGLGLDYAFSQEAYKAKEGVITGPVKGMRGYYLLKVTSKTAFDNAAYQAQRNTLRDQILSEKRSTLFSQFFQTIKENGDIEDARYKFFGRN